jgi:uncharacterized membrane-anchored protein YhcB (DUF1043 family)
MRGAAVGLEIVRLTGKIESSRVDQTGSDLEDLIGQLGNYRRVLTDAFANIAGAISELKSVASSIQPS